MAFTVTLAGAGPWLVIDYAGVVEGNQLLASRMKAASANADAAVRDFILDFTDVTEFVLSSDSVGEIHAIDRERQEKLPAGRCALVAARELVEIGATFMAAVSPLPLDYRTFNTRPRAEAWLRGELAEPPPSLPRRR